MTDERGIVRGISWRDLCPWLILFRTFGLASSLSVLVLGTAGAVLTPLGWKLARWAFVNPDQLTANPDYLTFTARTGQAPWESPRLPYAPDQWINTGIAQGGPVEVFSRLTEPVIQLFSLQPMPIGRWAYLVAGILWSIGVWGLFGGAITRIGVMRLGREEGIGMTAAVRFALGRWRSYVFAPLFPLLGVMLITVPCLVLGFLIRLDVGLFLAGIAWILVLLAGVAMAILLLGLGCGWPLMWATVSAEDDGDEFAALQHSFSYTFQRPLHYAGYALLSVLLGIASALVVGVFAQLVINSGIWAVSWGSGALRWQSISVAGLANSPSLPTNANADLSTIGSWGVGCLRFWQGLVWTVVAGFQHGFFWISSSAVYLLLRRDVDRTEFDEVYVADDQAAMTLDPIAASGPSSLPGQTSGAPPGATAVDGSAVENE